MIHLLLSMLLFLLLSSCGVNQTQTQTPTQTQPTPSSLPLDKISLPPGFTIQVYAENVENARSMDLSPEGTLFVGTRNKGKVYALRDENGDGYAEKKYTLIEKRNMPNGVAFLNGDLYVAEVNQILRFADIENHLANPPEPSVIFDGYPSKEHHGWKYIAFGPDGKLYVPVGAPCNICESADRIFNTITRLNPDGTGMEIVHEGIRNTVGFTWHPQTKELWFTDNGGDWLGDDMPACELNHAPRDGMHFGFPYCHQGDFPDPKFGTGKDCTDYTPPAQKLGPHVAPLGLEFITSDQFPEAYQGHILIAEHGSWNRSTPIGYRLTLVKLENGKAVSYEPFAEGWLEGKDRWGRPVDLEWMPDGSLLVSDDYANVIYRIEMRDER